MQEWGNLKCKCNMIVYFAGQLDCDLKINWVGLFANGLERIVLGLRLARVK